ncbi:MAG: NDP-sugar synthase [DPANN group archaeon]|nr:NDP-sugar synthase [DPANN group archaeon]
MEYQILIHAGGAGTRLQSLAKDLPKALVEVAGKQLILYAMSPFLKQGFNKFVMSASYKAEMLHEFFKKQNLDVKFIQEKELSGRAGAIRLGMEQGILDPNKPTIITHCDDIIPIDIRQLVASHEKSGCTATVVLSKSFVNPFGVAEVAGNRITGFTEKASFSVAANQGINTGMSVFKNLKLFEKAVIPSQPEYTIYPELARQGQINAFFVDKWYPVNTKEEHARFSDDLKSGKIRA